MTISGPIKKWWRKVSTELDGIHFAYEVWSIFFLLIAAILNLSPENNILGKFLEEGRQEHILNYLDFPFIFRKILHTLAFNKVSCDANSWICESCVSVWVGWMSQTWPVHTVVLINSTLLKTNLLAKLYQSWRQGKSLRDWIILPQVFTRNQGKYLELELVVPVVSKILLKTFSEIHQQDLNSILIKISTKEIILLWI